MSYDKCPNCSGTTSISRGKAICDYCGSEFAIENNSNGYDDSGETLAQRLFDFSNIKNFENEHCQKSTEEMCAWINAGDTVESCLEGLKNLASGHEKEWAVDNHNIELFNKIKPKVQGQMTSDERMLFYKDSGVFSVGKSGTLITNKNIFCIKKKGIEKLSLNEIYSIHALPLLGSGSWYFNANKNVEIDNMVCSRIEQGVIMALVCLLVQRYKGYGCKIKVYNGVL